MEKEVTNWNKYPVKQAEVAYFDTPGELRKLIGREGNLIARGLGRCYGDASLNNSILETAKYEKALDFDEENGVFECQAGLSLDEILKIIVPKGWFLPVTPGTKFITVGGAVASDVHGKNHHVDGSFGNHVVRMEIMLASGEVVSCGPDNYPDLFRATCGGMGLTGIILRVRFRLKKIESAYISQKQIKARNLDELMDYFQEYGGYTNSMAWIDCLKTGKQFGRSILMVGEHSRINELPPKLSADPLKVHGDPKISVPFNFPGFVLNKFSVKAFNALYYGKNFKKEQNSIVHYNPFFYPLDFIYSWNRMYGKKGFVQYQFVVPMDATDGLIRIMKKISEKNMGSFLTVLKVFGPQDSLISFPMEGYTLALDFAIEDGLFEFLNELDSIVAESGGRLYLTKDARMKADFFQQSYPHFEEFVEIVKRYNPEGKFSSLMSERLGII